MTIGPEPMMRTREGLDIPVQLLDRRPKFKNFDRAVDPVVDPAYDKVTLPAIVTMFPKVVASELELNVNLDVPAALYPAFRSAIWKTGADSLNQEPKLPSNHSKTGTRRPVRQWAHGVAHESSMVRQTCASPFVQQLSTQAKGAATQQGLQRS